MSPKYTMVLLPSLRLSVEQIVLGFDRISPERKEVLKSMAEYIRKQASQLRTVNLNFICTHNSRRSHLAQIWAQTAAYYYDIADVKCFSGGTEATAFNLRAVKAMGNAGFAIKKVKAGENPRYEVLYSKNEKPVIAFSKKYDDLYNPRQDFAAIMTCSHADENCPLVFGAAARFAITYDDPKDFDGTLLEEEKYNERVTQIGREMFYAFSLVRVIV